jgi:hypothetical protein
MLHVPKYLCVGFTPSMRAAGQHHWRLRFVTGDDGRFTDAVIARFSRVVRQLHQMTSTQCRLPRYPTLLNLAGILDTLI